MSVPTTFGASLPKENYSEVKSRGFEVELGYNDRIGKLDYYLRGNFSLQTAGGPRKMKQKISGHTNLKSVNH